MPKLKSCKSVVKRIRMTKNGKLIRNRQGKSHLQSTKSAKRRRTLRKATQIISKPFVKKIASLMG